MPEPYRLNITHHAQKEIRLLPPKIQRQVDKRIRSLKAVLDSGGWPQDVGPLQGRADNYRVDSGEYRILFHIDDEARVVTIFRVRHRREVYRGL
ncbi:MAG: type II toxin-antitoxin system RelE/ParE family toxin [Chloroflexi bacterium]|nr:type II toxin-antitoxin system RelE/ParE family toxin [Chloroflexota bacterium]